MYSTVLAKLHCASRIVRSVFARALASAHGLALIFQAAARPPGRSHPRPGENTAHDVMARIVRMH